MVNSTEYNTPDVIFLSENLPSKNFSDVTSETTLRMGYSSRVNDDGCGVCTSTDTSTYRHRDAGYGQPSRRHHRAPNVQLHFITPGNIGT